MDEKKTEIIAVRITPSLKKRLASRAKKGFRSISQEVEMILQKALGKKG